MSPSDWHVRGKAFDEWMDANTPDGGGFEAVRQMWANHLVDGLSDEQVATLLRELDGARYGTNEQIAARVRAILRRVLGARSVSGERGEPT